MRGKPGHWGHRNTGLSSLPLSTPCVATSDPTKPSTNEVLSSDDHPVDDIYFSSSDEADSDSPFPDSSDSEPETENFGQATSVRVSSRQKHFKPVCSGGGNGTENSADKPEEITSVSSASTHPGEDDTKPEVKEELPDGWTGAEVTYFRILHPVFGHNYCTMAEMIRTKTCRQLYEYGRVVSAELLLQHGECMERQQLVGKKKKRNMRLVGFVGIEHPLYQFTGQPILELFDLNNDLMCNVHYTAP